MDKEKNIKKNKPGMADMGPLEYLPVALVMFDNSRIYYFNKKASEILKLPKTIDLTKVDPYSFVVPEFRNRTKKINKEILQGAEFPPIELKIQDKKDKVIDVEAKSNRTVFNGKKVVQSVFHVISDRKKQHEELVESNQVLDLIGQNNTDIIFKYDFEPEEKYVYISDSVKKVLGYDPKEFYKNKDFYLKIIHPDDLYKIPSNKKKYIASKEKNKSSLVRYLKKDKTYAWIETDYSLIKDKKGKPISLLGICRNVNKLKLKEEELNQKWSNYQELLNESPIAFFIHKDGVCLMCNKAAVKILKTRSEQQVLGKYLINYIVPEQRAMALVRLKQSNQGKEHDFINYKIINAKGKIVDIELKTVPVKYNGEQCVLTIMNDVSNKGVFEKERIRAEIAEEHNKSLIREIELRKKIEKKLIENERQLTNQAAKLRAIFESSSHLVWTINNKMELTYYNQNFADVFKNKYKADPVIGEKAYDTISKEYRETYKDLWVPLYEEVLKGKQIIFERQDIDNDQSEIFREVYLNPITNENGEVFEIACLAHDITDNKRNEQQILEQSSRLKAIFESGTQLMWTVNKHLAFTSFNTNFYHAIHDLYGIYPEINKNLHRPQKPFATAEYHTFWTVKYEMALSGMPVEFMTERTNTKGQKIFRQMFLHPIYNQNNEVIEVSAMGIDITEKVLNEHKIINQSAKLNAIFNGSSHYIWTVDRSNRLTSFNRNYSKLIKEIYGIYPEEGLVLNRGKMIEDKDYNYWWDNHYTETFKGKTHNFEIEIIDLLGNKIYLEVFLNPIYDKDNHVTEISGIAHNITEKNLNREKITQSLNEKEVLLKEVHHRVKNNMQVISSILNLQSSYVKDEYALGLLKESQNRIKTMAYIHESLYQNKTFTSINFSEYISTLTNNILQSYAAATQKVRLVLEVQKVILNLDTSIPAGLIINELVTNSIKHAFTGANDGIILINLHTKNNALFLEVSDNGKGFPKEVDFKNTNSLGLQLVNTLIEQLNGTVELTENKYKGTSFFINFPM
jgi:PAS domain S-box-containing protein